MDEDEKNKALLFSLAIVFALGLAIFGYFCGGDMLKYKIGKVALSFFIVFIILVLIYLLFCVIPNWGKPKICPNAIYENSKLIVYDNSDYKHNDYDSELEEIVFVNARQKLEKAAFWGYSKLKRIELPAELEEIPDYAFAGCVALESISIPSSVKSIGEYAFFGCKNLKEVNLSKTKITEIKKGSFEGCEKLETIDFPANLAKIGKSAFKGCKKLETVSFVESIEIIEEYSFFGCNNLKSVVLPVKLSDISDFAFCGCVFKEIYIHRNITHIGNKAFSDCSNLNIVTFEVSENEHFDTIPNTLKQIIISGTSITTILLKTENTEVMDKLKNKLASEFRNRKIEVKSFNNSTGGQQ